MGQFFREVGGVASVAAVVPRLARVVVSDRKTDAR